MKRRNSYGGVSVAPVKSSKRTCIINTKGKTFCIRDEDRKRPQTITCQHLFKCTPAPPDVSKLPNKMKMT